MILLYSVVLAVGLAISSPWLLYRMVTTQRYREGLWERLGGVPAALRAVVQGREVVWLHAVSVGEMLAASRLVAELEAALGEGFRVVISTTTRTGRALARERFGAERVFYIPLDFAWPVRRYLRALKPRALVLMESELWPRMLHECARAGVPVAVVNARVSDRSFKRAMWVPAVWTRALRKVTLWLTQTEEDKRRLEVMGVRAEAVRVAGNLKYDVRAPKVSRVAELIKLVASGRPIVVAGSTVARVGITTWNEEVMVLRVWDSRALLVVAPRHPERFSEVEGEAAVNEFPVMKASGFAYDFTAEERTKNGPLAFGVGVGVVLLDTIGDLAAVYGVADVAFVGGSLVKRGGHNPLEPAQFGVPVVMGPSYENFRDIVGKMITADAIRIVQDEIELASVITELLTNREAALAMGERGRRVFEEQQGATGRSVAALVGMIKP
jgi:3-deoxy-D-manno-octulosonic-acid transferase